MSLLAPLTTLAVGILAEPRPSPEALQRAAQVRAAMLTRDWSWLKDLMDSGDSKDVHNPANAILFGLRAWVVKSPTFDVLASRLEVLRDATVACGSLVFWRFFDAFEGALARQGLPSKWPNTIYLVPYQLREKGWVTEVLPAWGDRPQQG